MSLEDDPPRKHYGFKEREFKRDNATGPEGAPPTVQDLAKLAGPVVKSPRGATGPKADDPNDVYHALLKNRALEKAHGLDEMEIRKIKRRKFRDYMIIMVPTQLVLGTITVLGAGNPVVFVSGLAGMVMTFATITWVMWQIVEY